MAKCDFLVRCSPEQFLTEFMPLPPGYTRDSTHLALDVRVYHAVQTLLSCESLFHLLKDSDLCPSLEFQQYVDVFPQIAGYSVSRRPVDSGINACYNDAELIIESTLVSHRKQNTESTPMAFMDELFTHQHRTHFFSLHIHNNDFRFVRWDRTAVVATDIVAASSSAPLLVEFFKRFNLMDPQARGHDTSAARATASEQDMLLQGVKQVNGEHGYLRGSAQTMVSKFLPYRIRVDSAKGTNPQYYIVQGPCTRGDGLLGPSMRGYWAWCVSCAELVFLKDAWGPVPGNTSEADTLCTLFVNPYMPQILGTGPVLGDHRLPQRSVPLYGDGDNKQLEHHRVVQELSINLDLKELCRPRQVVQAIRNTLLVVKHSFEDCSIAHTNITPDNIMYNPKTQRAFLVNWEHAIPVEHAFTLDYKPKPSQYQSIWSHLTTKRIYQIQDDVESCFWSLLDIALACGQPAWGPAREEWRKTFEDVFNPTHPATHKLKTLLGPELHSVEFSSPALTATIRGFAAKIKKIYNVPGVDLISLSDEEKVRVLNEYYWQVPAEKEVAEISPLVEMLDGLLWRSDWEEPLRPRW